MRNALVPFLRSVSFHPRHTQRSDVELKLQLTLCLLRYAQDPNSMTSVVDVLHHYAAIWSCMNAIPSIVQTLYDAYQTWKSRGLQSRPLLGILMESDNGRHLAEAYRNQIVSDIIAFRMVSTPHLVRSKNFTAIPSFLNYRLCNQSVNTRTLFQSTSPRSITSAQRRIRMLQGRWPMGYGSNTECRPIGLRESGVTHSRVFSSFRHRYLGMLNDNPRSLSSMGLSSGRSTSTFPTGLTSTSSNGSRRLDLANSQP